jgi:uncharacterized repeat protein (TIGR03803 family)
MLQKKCLFRMSGILAVFVMAIMLATGAVADSTYKVLHRFRGPRGAMPYSRLIFDAAGNLYGTTSTGGAAGMGTVFELKPNPDGSWTESMLHSFCSVPHCADGRLPYGEVGLLFDAAGNLYGATSQGGTSNNGTVFKLKPNPDGSWTENVLYSFTGGSDGREPTSIIFDVAGNIYGTTNVGGDLSSCNGVGCGVVFKLTRHSDESWTQSVLYTFCSSVKCSEGILPLGGMIFDRAGNLYGTTLTTALGGAGTVFKLKPNSDGSWTHTTLHTFHWSDGAVPVASLTLDTAGNLYGTTEQGGDLSCGNKAGCGVVFKLSPNSDGSWTESVLYSFNNRPANPRGAVIFDPSGNLYSVTANRGPADGGVVFELQPQSDGSWVYSRLHMFLGKPALNPQSGLVFDKTGNLYGTTVNCGSGMGCYGVVFKITP